MTEEQIKAIRFALSILEPFKESSLYDTYQEIDGFTDEEYDSHLAALSGIVQ